MTGIVAGLALVGLANVDRLAELAFPQGGPRTVSLQSLAIMPDAISRAMPVCGAGRRVNCVVDGDTIWVDREKIRLDSVNAPETDGACERERRMAGEATRRLSVLLSSQPFTVSRRGRDRYGRTLAKVSTRDGDVGMALARDGYAHVWRGRRESWC